MKVDLQPHKLGGKRQKDHEFKARLGYKVSSGHHEVQCKTLIHLYPKKGAQWLLV